MNDGRYDFDLARFRRAVRSRFFVREYADSTTFRIPYSEFEAWYDKVKPHFIPWDEMGDFAPSFDRSEQLARRKLIREAERYGEEMHESRHDA